MEPLSAEYARRDAELIVSTYAKAPLDLVRGEGAWLWDRDGQKILDFVSGIAVNALGHSHPAVVAAIRAQSEKFLHLSNLYPNGPQLELADRLMTVLQLKEKGWKAFFCNSGTEANEGAIKFARKYFDRLGEGRTRVVSFVNSFHGRTYGALAATGQAALQQGFGPLPADFVHVSWNDVDALFRAVDARTCAIMLEPIAAEGGILTPSPAFVSAINALRARTGCLVIADEIQTGLGRCGALSGAALYGLQADMTTWAKALGGGLPLGMVLMDGRIAAQMKPGDHGTTFGGNPVACAAGLAVVNTVSAAGFLDGVAARSAQLRSGLEELARRYAWLGEVRGAGLLLGIVSRKPVSDLIAACRNQGILVHRAGADVLRLLPPLTIGEADVDEALRRVDRACATLDAF